MQTLQPKYTQTREQWLHAAADILAADLFAPAGYVVPAVTISVGFPFRARGMGNNAMLCADLASGEFRRFLTGPRGCEVTGVIQAPDQRTMFRMGRRPSGRSCATRR